VLCNISNRNREEDCRNILRFLKMLFLIATGA
jgi:hypothetical protein